MNTTYRITDTEFQQLSSLLYSIAGITLTEAKKVLLCGRLAKRLKALGMQNYTQYFKFVTSEENAEELQFMVNLLTTNETYFFREPQHFEFLRDVILRQLKPDQPFNVWSAAASNGAEAYTIAMILAEKLGTDGSWDILGTDISLSVLEIAKRGQYRLAEAEKIPPALLKKYCLKGMRSQEGTFLVDRKLRQHVHFVQANLNAEKFVKPGNFDVIFLRNVLIYFDMPTKKRVVNNIIPCLKPKGYLIVGHSESLNGVTNVLPQLQPTIYQRP